MRTHGRQFPKEVILTAVRWYLVYRLSYRQVEDLLLERGVRVDHTTIHRWVIRYIEQDHRGVKRPLRPMLGLKSFSSAAATIAGVELAHMLRKGQGPSTWLALSMAQRFTKLAA